ncbi:MAG: ABC transporter ATP-binding protein [Synergistaceae bacterium]|jgi:ABC-type nitrate/sulfonate/bicarbonate transport system ATPase subunit|nr:ABC transporter ATP-binding protein [Synergistaceae bacterium]
MAGQSGRKGHIVIENVSKIFARGDMNSTLVALKNIDMEIMPCEFVSIVGASGCGKSTLLRVIAGLETTTVGNAMCDGKTITGTDPRRGLVFQENALFPWLSVRDNISFGLRATKKYELGKKLVDDLISMAGLSEFSNSYPHHLSGGMRQRAALARALAVSPDVLLLDEPLGALDSFTRMNLQDEMLNLWHERGNTMILITHDVDEAVYLSERIYVMSPRPGMIVDEISLPMSYPRNRGASDFMDIRNAILRKLHFAREDSQEYNL